MIDRCTEALAWSQVLIRMRTIMQSRLCVHLCVNLCFGQVNEIYSSAICINYRDTYRSLEKSVLFDIVWHFKSNENISASSSFFPFQKIFLLFYDLLMCERVCLRVHVCRNLLKTREFQVYFYWWEVTGSLT